jgi:hypothetical protein
MWFSGPLPSGRLGRAPFMWTSAEEDVWGNCWEKSTDGEDKEGRLGEVSWSSWQGFKLLVMLALLVLLLPLALPLRIIGWTREVWNSPLFIAAISERRREMSCCYNNNNKCSSLTADRLEILL